MNSVERNKAEAKRCARCGACTAVCPVYRASGGKESYSGRGKKHLLEVLGEDPPSPVFEDIFAKCLLCGSCVTACPRQINIPAEVRLARSRFSTFYGEHGYAKFLARKILEHPELLGVVRSFGHSFKNLLEKTLPADSGLRLHLALFDETAKVSTGSHFAESDGEIDLVPLLYFPGCSASHLYPEVIKACTALFRYAGYSLTIPGGLTCCGLAIDSAGDLTRSRVLAKRNIEALERLPGPIMVSCGSCLDHLRRYGEVLAEEPGWFERGQAVAGRLVEMSCLLLDRLPDPLAGTDELGKAAVQRVFYQDPCHLRHGTQVTAEPRQLIRRFPGLELVELPDGPQCCGHGGLFHLGAPQLSAGIRDDLAAKVLSLSPDIITSSCSGCLMQWRMAMTAAGKKLPVLHLAELLGRQLFTRNPG